MSILGQDLPEKQAFRAAPAALVRNNTESAVTSLSNTRKAPYTTTSKQYFIDRRQRFSMRYISGNLLNNRTKSCGRIMSISANKFSESQTFVSGHRVDDGDLHYKGLINCSNVWTCPVCAPRIAKGRADEVRAAMAKNRKEGGQVLMMTFTSQHNKSDQLADVLKKQRAALSSLKSYSAYKKLRKEFGHKGTIRAYEVTHGKNGWHPHTHELFFINRVVSVEESLYIQAILLKAWQTASLKAGLKKPNKHGIKVDLPTNDDDVISYVTKWSHELTSTHTKTKSEGRSPWMILSDLTDQYSFQDSKLFKEYAAAFKGVSQLYWSPKMKDHFEINQKDDDEVMVEGRELFRINPESWFYISKQRAESYLLDIVEIADNKGLDCQYFADKVCQEMRDLELSNIRERHTLRKSITAYTLKRYSELF